VGQVFGNQEIGPALADGAAPGRRKLNQYGTLTDRRFNQHCKFGMLTVSRGAGKTTGHHFARELRIAFRAFLRLNAGVVPKPPEVFIEGWIAEDEVADNVRSALRQIK
jgi:hypothetical protein